MKVILWSYENGHQIIKLFTTCSEILLKVQTNLVVYTTDLAHNSNEIGKLICKIMKIEGALLWIHLTQGVSISFTITWHFPVFSKSSTASAIFKHHCRLERLPKRCKQVKNVVQVELRIIFHFFNYFVCMWHEHVNLSLLPLSSTKYWCGKT